MRDLVDRQEVIDALYNWSNHSATDAETWHLRQVIGDIKSLPPAQSEQEKGEWSFIGDNLFECTCCRTMYTTQQLAGLRNNLADPYAPNFCPNCGADMRGDDNG